MPGSFFANDGVSRRRDSESLEGRGERKISYESFISLAASASTCVCACARACVCVLRASRVDADAWRRERHHSPLSLSFSPQHTRSRSYALEKLHFLLGHNYSSGYPFSLPRLGGVSPAKFEFFPPSPRNFSYASPLDILIIDLSIVA